MDQSNRFPGQRMNHVQVVLLAKPTTRFVDEAAELMRPHCTHSKNPRKWIVLSVWCWHSWTRVSILILAESNTRQEERCENKKQARLCVRERTSERGAPTSTRDRLFGVLTGGSTLLVSSGCYTTRYVLAAYHAGHITTHTTLDPQTPQASPPK